MRNMTKITQIKHGTISNNLAQKNKIYSPLSIFDIFLGVMFPLNEFQPRYIANVVDRNYSLTKKKLK